MSVLISVVIPVYNTAKYLRRCMDSVINQTYRNLEIICVDDGSTDESGKILDEYATRDGRITVVHKENGGLVSARKAGVLRATGAYVSYVDSDDEIALTRYEELLENGINQNADIIFTDVTQVYGDGRRLKLNNYFEKGFYSKERINSDLIINFCDLNHFHRRKLRIYVWGVLFKTKLIKKCQLLVDDVIIYGEDAACMMSCLSAAESAYMANAGGYIYHKNNDSMCHKADETGALVQKTKISNRGLYRHLKRTLLSFSPNVRTVVQREIVMDLFYATLNWDYTSAVRLIGDSEDIFPYMVAKGKRVVIYGAGTFGMQLYRHLSSYDSDTNIVLWCDRAWESFRANGYDVSAPEEIKTAEYDYVLMAIGQYDVAENAEKSLINMGIPAEKIRFMDVNELTKERLERIYEEK